MIKIKNLVLILALVGSSLYLIKALAAQYYNAPYLAGVIIAEHGDCYQVINYCSGSTMFVPTNTVGEWNSVKSSSPACLSKSDLGYAYCYGMGMGMGMGGDGGDGY